MYLVTAGQMQEMDKKTIEDFGIPGRVLMENAGRGATRFFLEQFKNIERKNIGVVAGRGNNGGDGFVIARYLAQKNIQVTVFLLSQSIRVKGDAAANLDLLEPLNIPVIELPDQASFSANKVKLKEQDIWIDAILGTGLKSEVAGYFKTVIDYINLSNKPVFSVDIPSGINSDTGQSCGAHICAKATATFAYAKTGHFLLPGAEYTGNLSVIDIGIPTHIAEEVGPKQYLLTAEHIGPILLPRPADAHKGHTGHLLIIAGATGKTGAAAMAAVSAMRTGAGLVTLGIPASLNPVLEILVTEPMTYPLPEDSGGVLGESSFDEIKKLSLHKKCLAAGPGIGTAPGTARLIHRIIQETSKPMVIDADGLNCVAGHADILKKTDIPLILTPHPGEMARLIDSTPAKVQKDRLNCARSFAEKFNVHVVLKGAGTVMAHPDGSVFINSTGNPGMASGGMGDVLTGMIAGFITQGYSPESAIHAGVFIHGAVADELALKVGPFGYLATDVMEAIPGKIKNLISRGQK